MLSKEENDFIKYWEKNRLRRKKVFRQFLLGIPLGLLIVIPTVISLTSGWYKRADMEANSGEFNPMVLMVALLLIVGFTAIFYQRWQWEQYEQRYRELVAKRDRSGREPAGERGAGGDGASLGENEFGSGNEGRGSEDKERGTGDEGRSSGDEERGSGDEGGGSGGDGRGSGEGGASPTEAGARSSETEK